MTETDWWTTEDAANARRLKPSEDADIRADGGDHSAITDSNNGGVTIGCSCGWQSEPFRSDKQSWHQWIEHKVAQSTPSPERAPESGGGRG